MNIHPLFVHFPIGLLVVYSVLEIGAYVSPTLRRQSWLFGVKAFLLFVGVLAAFTALVTGGMAEELVENTERAFILEVHSPIAGITTLLYLVLASAYLICVFDRNGWWSRLFQMNKVFAWSWHMKKSVAHFILDTWFLPVLALLALIGMTVTGALGAAIVYGPNADPFVTFIYHLFWAQ
ncbi:MAG: hypothetical protein NTV60_00465 [Candidatus Kaiserbacteria bacterium]|nr:hypothetical protein [Candidatus Kaiserbacteria bacterium]